MGDWYHVYVIYRIDYWVAGRGGSDRTENTVTIKEVLKTEEEALKEVDRLRALNADKDCDYFFQSAKFYPAGR